MSSTYYRQHEYAVETHLNATLVVIRKHNVFFFHFTPIPKTRNNDNIVPKTEYCFAI